MELKKMKALNVYLKKNQGELHAGTHFQFYCHYPPETILLSNLDFLRLDLLASKRLEITKHGDLCKRLEKKLNYQEFILKNKPRYMLINL